MLPRLQNGPSIIYLFVLTIIASPRVGAFYKEEPKKSIHHQSDHLNLNLFDSLAYSSSTDEAKLRLALLVDDKIDGNHDGLVQLDELVNWIKECQRKYTKEDVKRHWINFGKSSKDEDNENLTWEEYTNRQYEHLLGISKQAERPEQIAGIKSSYENAVRKDLRRWKAADSSQDGMMSLKEFESFLHPEQFEHMHEISVVEKFENLDKNKDEKISIDEYLADLSLEGDQTKSMKRNEWIKEETTKFNDQLDINHDSYLDKSELSRIMSKSELDDHSITEAQHLMSSADSNRDHRLSKEEILSAYHEFINSHATDFGEALKGQNIVHDEL